MKKKKWEPIRIDTRPKTVVRVIEHLSPIFFEGRGKVLATHELEKFGSPMQAEDVWNVIEIKAMGVDPKCRVLEMNVHVLPEEVFDRLRVRKKVRG